MYFRKDRALYAKRKKTDNFIEQKSTSYFGVHRNLKNGGKYDVTHGRRGRTGQCVVIVNFGYLESTHVYLVMHKTYNFIVETVINYHKSQLQKLFAA